MAKSPVVANIALPQTIPLDIQRALRALHTSVGDLRSAVADHNQRLDQSLGSDEKSLLKVTSFVRGQLQASGRFPLTVSQLPGAGGGGSSSSNQTVVNSGSPSLSFGDLIETGSAVLTITGGTRAVIGDGVAIQVAQATATANGYLGSADWNTFNNKQNALGYVPLNPANNLSDVASVSSARTNLGLATVAASGSYNDLSNKPTIPAAQINSDWNASSGVAQILNKPTIPAAQVNSDWNAVSGVAQILNKPTIPAPQVNSDWNAVSGVAQILNKPAIPTKVSQLTNDSNFITSSGAPVQSVATRTGAITLTHSDITDWSTATAGFGGGSNPMTTLGDTTYGGTSGTPTRLAGNITAAKQFLTQTGTGSASAAPGWAAIAAADVPVLNQNTTGNAATATTAGNVTGVVAIVNGGTGATNFSQALLNLGGVSLAANQTINGINTFTQTINAATPSTATSALNYSGPALNFISSYWTGSAAAQDIWTIKGGVAPSGSNPSTFLQISHSGSPSSTGSSAIQLQAPVSTTGSITAGGVLNLYQPSSTSYMNISCSSGSSGFINICPGAVVGVDPRVYIGGSAASVANAIYVDSDNFYIRSTNASSTFLTVNSGGAQILGANQATTNGATFNTSGALGGSVLLFDTGAASQNGGAVLFAAASGAWKFAAIKGCATYGGGNTQGDISFQVRLNSTDSTLTETFRLSAGGSGAVTFQYPGSIVFGSGWQTYTINMSGNNSMTVNVTYNSARYIRIGPFVYVYGVVSFTLGGSLSNLVLWNVPTGTASGINAAPLACKLTTPATSFDLCHCFVDLPNNRFACYYANGQNYPSITGTYSLYFSGFYPVS